MKTSKQITVSDNDIVQKIYVVRGVKVMLDKDLAEMYGVETKRLKEAVRRNVSRFPEDFMFELSEAEFNNLRSQIATSSWGGARYMPWHSQNKVLPCFPLFYVQKGQYGKYPDCKSIYKNAAVDIG